MVFRRVMGKFGFMQIRDLEDKIQVSVGINELNDVKYDFYKKMIDIGDFVGVEGEIYHTQTGEITVKAYSVTLLSKALRPLPEKFHGLVARKQNIGKDISTLYQIKPLAMFSWAEAKCLPL